MEGENFAPFEGFLNSFQSGPMAYVIFRRRREINKPYSAVSDYR